MSKLQKIAVAGFVALVLYLVLGTVGTMFFDCDSVGIHKADSPDGRYRAAIGVETCKDSTQNGVWVFFANIETGSNVRRTLVKDTSITDFELNWQGNDELEISVPSGVDWGYLRGPSNFERVRVEYRKAYIAAPERSQQIISEPAAPDELIAVFEQGDTDAVVYALNEIKASPVNSEVIELVRCAFEKCDGLDPSWSNPTINDPLVRINMADVLVQAGRRGHAGIDEPALLQFVLVEINGSVEEVRQRCLMILSYIGGPENVARIVDVAHATDDLSTFRYAVIALKHINSGRAIKALKELLRESDERKRDHVADIFENEIGYDL
jgi:hypothetical protein